jgi:hypothetical protein
MSNSIDHMKWDSDADTIKKLREENERLTKQLTVLLVVKMALRILLNHVEPGWENCTALVKAWLDEQKVGESTDYLKKKETKE